MHEPPAHPTHRHSDRYLVAGASGQLARSFRAYADAQGIHMETPSESSFDITSPTAVADTLSHYRPTVLLNCAAYNNVDGAESTPQPAFRINAEAVERLASACRSHGARLVHYGTDYVFDGRSDTPYLETDTPHPLNAYGASKLAGEEAALAYPDALVLRVSWVYGPGEQNFLHKLLAWSQGRDTLDVVADQISTPTFTDDIVLATFEALDAGLCGLYHLVNHGHASRIEVARTFFAAMRRPVTLNPVPSSHFPSPAQRPLFSALNPGKLETALGHTLPTWQDALIRFCRTCPGHP